MWLSILDGGRWCQNDEAWDSERAETGMKVWCPTTSHDITLLSSAKQGQNSLRALWARLLENVLGHRVRAGSSHIEELHL